VWHVRSEAIDSGLIAKPDLVSNPKVTQVIVGMAGIGVLREDGSLRVWNTKEVRLPQVASQEISAVVPHNNAWSVLKRDGSVVRFALTTSVNNVTQTLAEATVIDQYRKSSIAIAGAGYGTLLKQSDGSWTTTAPGDVEDALKAMHTDKNESFSVFRGVGKTGMLWIEPEL
jgi:hypothetical protein